MPDVECGFRDIPGGASGNDLLVFYGPTIAVDIGFDPAYKPSQGGVPVAGIQGMAALVDTGATESCIDSMLATQLNLPIVDKRIMAAAHGAREVNVHLAQIHVPTLQFTIWGEFAAVDLSAGGQPHKALLGRTFLRSLTMTYVGSSGAVTVRRV
jgi:predicted aspartyl protease